MSRIFILAFVLLATLFAVNAAPLALEKRETKFEQCPNLPPTVAILDLKITPEPVVAGGDETFDVKGTMQKDLVTGDLIVFAFIDLFTNQPIEDPLIVDLCSLPGVTCPIKAGTVFSTTQKYTAPPQFPDSYVIGVGIETGKPDYEPLGCAVAFVGDNVSSADLEVLNFL